MRVWFSLSIHNIFLLSGIGFKRIEFHSIGSLLPGNNHVAYFISEKIGIKMKSLRRCMEYETKAEKNREHRKFLHTTHL